MRSVSEAAVGLAARLARGRWDRRLELMYVDGMALVREAMGLPAPPDPDAGAWLLVEASGGQDPSGMLAEAIEDSPGVTEVAVGDEVSSRARLWAYRERHTEAIATLWAPHKLDLTLPMKRFAEFAGAVRSEIALALGGPSDAQVIMFGHVGDGNLHVNIVGPEPEDYPADDAVFRMVLGRGGSISAEHGVGVAKLGLSWRLAPPATWLSCGGSRTRSTRGDPQFRSAPAARRLAGFGAALAEAYRP